jgi:hypothetical protein
VPQSFRGGLLQVYDLYLVKQASAWGDRPLYLADEWVAYTNGSQVALELAESGDKDPNRWSEIQNAIYFNMFCAVVYSLTDKNEELTEFFRFQLNRVQQVFDKSQDHPPLRRAETGPLLDEFKASEFYKPFSEPDKLKDYGSEEYL